MASAHYCHAPFAVQKKIASRFFQLSLVMAFELFACSYYLILCSCWFCASIISALKNSAPPDAEFADQFLEGCTSIILALKKSAHHAQKCTDWFLLEHYASIHINHFSSYKVCLPDPKGAGLNPYMICAQLQQSSLSTRELTIAAICSSVFSSRQQRYLVFNSRISNINFKQIFALTCLMIAPTS